MQDIKPKVLGNEMVVRGLERALKRAQAGTIRAAAVIMVEHQAAETNYLGDENAKASISFGADMLKRVIMDAVVNVQGGTRMQDNNNLPPANQWTYDLNIEPVSFDFFYWLIAAEMVRRRENAPAPLQVSFAWRQSPLIPHIPAENKMLDNVMRPGLALFGAVEGNNNTRGRAEHFVGLRDIALAYAAGEQVPQITVPEKVAANMTRDLEGRHPVTITMREASYQRNRNSNLEEWRKLAAWLRDRGEDVIVVRDTAKAHEPFHDFTTCAKASIHLQYRAAIYSQAKANLFVQNGPFVLGMLQQVPWLLFAQVDDTAPEEFNRPEAWKIYMPRTADGQMPWATPQQRIIYKPDTFEHMAAAYEDLRL